MHFAHSTMPRSIGKVWDRWEPAIASRASLWFYLFVCVGACAACAQVCGSFIFISFICFSFLFGALCCVNWMKYMQFIKKNYPLPKLGFVLMFCPAQFTPVRRAPFWFCQSTQWSRLSYNDMQSWWSRTDWFQKIEIKWATRIRKMKLWQQRVDFPKCYWLLHALRCHIKCCTYCAHAFSTKMDYSTAVIPFWSILLLLLLLLSQSFSMSLLSCCLIHCFKKNWKRKNH